MPDIPWHVELKQVVALHNTDMSSHSSKVLILYHRHHLHPGRTNIFDLSTKYKPCLEGLVWLKLIWVDHNIELHWKLGNWFKITIDHQTMTPSYWLSWDHLIEHSLVTKTISAITLPWEIEHCCDLVLSLHVMTRRPTTAWGNALATPGCQLSWYSQALSDCTVMYNVMQYNAM